MSVILLLAAMLMGTEEPPADVVFSPSLYLDDLGGDAAARGTPPVNLKDDGRSFSGDVGLGLAFIRPGQADAAVE